MSDPIHPHPESPDESPHTRVDAEPHGTLAAGHASTTELPQTSTDQSPETSSNHGGERTGHEEEGNKPLTQYPVRVLILFNQPVLADDHPLKESEHEVEYIVDHTRKTLLAAGMTVETLPVGRDPAVLVRELQERRPEVVFNLFEGLGDAGGTEATAAGILEWLEIPFTGCPSPALSVARDKISSKRLLAGAGLPVAGFLCLRDNRVPACPFEWPVMVKPAGQDASVGIDHNSVVSGQESLVRRVDHVLREHGGPVMVEEYLPGREFSVVVLEIEGQGLVNLPAFEIRFEREGPGVWPIFTYDAKWEMESEDFNHTPLDIPAHIDNEMQQKLGRIAREAFEVLGCRDYARIDFRLDGLDEPRILELNPNPDLSPDACLSSTLHSCGPFSHEEFLVSLVIRAHQRGGMVRTVHGAASRAKPPAPGMSPE
jgi:D-alanine-D-alanine ligase